MGDLCREDDEHAADLLGVGRCDGEVRRKIRVHVLDDLESGVCLPMNISLTITPVGQSTSSRQVT